MQCFSSSLLHDGVCLLPSSLLSSLALLHVYIFSLPPSSSSYLPSSSASCTCICLLPSSLIFSLYFLICPLPLLQAAEKGQSASDLSHASLLHQDESQHPWKEQRVFPQHLHPDPLQAGRGGSSQHHQQQPLEPETALGEQPRKQQHPQLRVHGPAVPGQLH